MPKQQVRYKDLDIKFESHPVTKKINVLKDNDAISQALKLLILTDKYERLMQPDIRTDVKAHFFENMTPTTASILANYIKTAVRNYEPRAKILNLEIRALHDRNSILIKITYSGINNFQPVTVNVFLEKIR